MSRQMKMINKIMKDFKHYVEVNPEIKEDYTDHIIDLWEENKELPEQEFEILINKKRFYFEELKLFIKEKYPKDPFEFDYEDINYKGLKDFFDKYINIDEF